jgi:hypothetical protein
METVPATRHLYHEVSTVVVGTEPMDTSYRDLLHAKASI